MSFVHGTNKPTLSYSTQYCHGRSQLKITSCHFVLLVNLQYEKRLRSASAVIQFRLLIDYKQALVWPFFSAFLMPLANNGGHKFHLATDHSSLFGNHSSVKSHSQAERARNWYCVSNLKCSSASLSLANIALVSKSQAVSAIITPLYRLPPFTSLELANNASPDDSWVETTHSHSTRLCHGVQNILITLLGSATESIVQ